MLSENLKWEKYSFVVFTVHFVLSGTQEDKKTNKQKTKPNQTNKKTQACESVVEKMPYFFLGKYLYKVNIVSVMLS